MSLDQTRPDGWSRWFYGGTPPADSPAGLAQTETAAQPHVSRLQLQPQPTTPPQEISMENTSHTLQDLFLQLGVPEDDAAIEEFIARHRPLAPQWRLADAPIWTESQADFLRDKLREDGDWSMLIDELDARLRDHAAAGDLEQAAEEPALQGEGNIAAARRYDEKAQAFAESGRVGAAARKAAPQTAEEATEMRKAEAVGLSKARA